MSIIGSLAEAAKANLPPIQRLLNQGTRGDDVKAVQSKLNTFGAGKLTPDGAFGQKTYDAVVQFQKMLQLKADGIVGQKTADALGFNYSGPTFGGAGAVAAAAIGAVGGVASMAGGSIGAATGQVGSSKAHDFLVKFSHALGQGLAGAVGGPTGSALAALQKQAASDVMTKILPAVQRGRYGETAAGIANTGAGMVDAGANEARQLKAKLVDAGANLPVVGGLFSEFERTLFG